jgi:hypothetical protein
MVPRIADGASGHPTDDALRAEILHIAEQRGSARTLCPSEAARSINGDAWRDLMPAARRIAFELAGEGRVDVTQQGLRVEPGVRGPIRIRWIDCPADRNDDGNAGEHGNDGDVGGGGLPAVGAPALRALHAAGYRDITDLDGVREQDIAALHGVGPAAVRILRRELERRGLSFAVS